jgi:Flp pilus assembly protein TadG
MYVCRRRMPPRRSESGAVAVEFALIVPLLIALLLAIITGGVAFSRSVSLNDAVRAGARVGATKAITVSDTWAADVQSATTAASADGLVAANVCVLLVKGPSSSLVRASSPSCTLAPVPATPTGLAATDCVVKVWGQRPVTFNALFVNSSVTLKRAAVLRYERTC